VAELAHSLPINIDIDRYHSKNHCFRFRGLINGYLHQNIKYENVHKNNNFSIKYGIGGEIEYVMVFW
jgi:hypothetical protein